MIVFKKASHYLNKYLFILLFSFLLMGLYFALVQPLLINDTYYHLIVGREVSQTGSIPTKDNFVYGSTNTNYVSAEWLSGLLFYLLFNALGNYGLLFFRTLCGFLVLYFLYKSFRLFYNNSLPILVLLIIVGYLLPIRLQTRPEMFSLVFLSIINYVGLHYFFKKTFPLTGYTLPLIFLAWPNLHGFSPLGFFLFFFLFGISFLLGKIPLAKTQSFLYLGIFVLSLLSGVVFYQRVFSFIYVAGFSQYIPEWANLWNRLFPTGLFLSFNKGLTIDLIIFPIMLLIYIFLIIRIVWREGKFPNILSLCGLAFFILPFLFYRLITPILIIIFPYLLLLVSQSHFKLPNFSKWFFGLVYVFFVFLTLLSIIRQGQLGGEGGGAVFPERTTQFIKLNLQTKRLFTIYFWNEYFIWNMPAIKTYGDVMTQYRTLADLEDEGKLHTPIYEEEVRALLKKYDIDTVVNTQPDAERIINVSLTPVFNNPEWKLVYVDSLAAVYARKDIIKNQPLNLSSVHPEFVSPNKYKLEEKDIAVSQLQKLLEFDKTNEFARSQLNIFKAKQL